MSVPIRPKAAKPRESRPGKSPLSKPQSDHTFATFACKHSEKQLFADETALLTAPDRVCPEENRHGLRVGEGRFPALCVPGIQGGLFLDSGVSRLKMESHPNCGVVFTVGLFSPFSLFTQIPTQSVGGLVSTPKVPHVIDSSAVHRPHMCRRHETNSATPGHRRAAEP